MVRNTSWVCIYSPIILFKCFFICVLLGSHNLLKFRCRQWIKVSLNHFIGGLFINFFFSEDQRHKFFNSFWAFTKLVPLSENTSWSFPCWAANFFNEARNVSLERSLSTSKLYLQNKCADVVLVIFNPSSFTRLNKDQSKKIRSSFVAPSHNYSWFIQPLHQIIID